MMVGEHGARQEFYLSSVSCTTYILIIKSSKDV
jgi:hypothetical protein